MEQLSFRVEAFEGPLDLLLTLIKKNKVNIYDIPISEILEQYLEVIAQMEALDLEVSSEFLVLAATLLQIKSRLLLPAEDEEEEGEFSIRTKTFPIKPMSVEEAILQMNLLEHHFFMFRDAETNEPCVVYRRKAGDYGLIVAEE